MQKMVKVCNDSDRWSLISLSNNSGKNVELKFVDSLRRQFEFSVDSFQIKLDSLLLFYECSENPMTETFHPTIIGESVYGDFHEAFDHLCNKIIATRNPEEIRGGDTRWRQPRTPAPASRCSIARLGEWRGNQGWSCLA